MTQSNNTSSSSEFKLSDCRACGGHIEEVLSLGDSPLANSLLKHADDLANTYPLGLSKCRDCGLVQNSVCLPTDMLFGNDYPYLSSVSKAVRDHATEIAKAIRLRVGGNAKAVEVGSNDGTVQLALHRAGIVSFGVDPANIAVEKALNQGCAALCSPFDETATEIVKDRFGTADIVHMSNVLAHVPNPLSVLQNAMRVLKTDGMIMIEVQSWLALVESGGFDMIYHEHHCHFDLTSLSNLCARAGLGVTEVEDLTTQGGSLRVWCKPTVQHSEDVLARIAGEKSKLASATNSLKQKIDHFLDSVKEFEQATAGRTVWGYGAAAKTVTLLASCGGTIGIQSIVDAAPSKIGRYLPIETLPIVSPEELASKQPDVVVLFAWNLAKEIMPILGDAEVWVPIPRFHRVS